MEQFDESEFEETREQFFKRLAEKRYYEPLFNKYYLLDIHYGYKSDQMKLSAENTNAAK